jgi:MoaA/NifB/PqqE/SkfB family radical SAM enzyme
MPAATSAIAPIHDFSRKLMHPGLRPAVFEYVAWRREVRAARAAGAAEPPLPHIGPLSVNLDLTTACNYACDHCIDWDALNLAVRHDEAELLAALRNLAARGLKSVILIGGGEPTVHPAFGAIVRFLKQELRVQVAVVSNGSRNEKIAEVADCFTRGDWVRLSLDAGSNATFQSMHKPKGKGVTLDEICERAGAIKRANPAVHLGFSFVITWRGAQRDEVRVEENLHEMEMAAQRARESGFDYISFKPFLTRAAAGAEILDPAQAEEEQERIRSRIRDGLLAAARHENSAFRVVESTNLRVFLDGTWREFTRQPHECHMQALRQVLSPLGTFNCPAHRGVAKARIGGKAAWAGDGAEGVAGTLRVLDRFDAAHECREVTCLYNPVNHYLEKWIASDDALDGAAPDEMPPGSDDFFL